MRKCLSILSALILICSCKTEEFQPSQSISFSAEIEIADFNSSEEETKTTISYVARLSWSKSDQVSVINLTTGKLLGGRLSAASAGIKTSFEGNLTGNITNGDELMLVYPPLENNTGETSISNFTLDFSSQDGSSSSNVYFAGYLRGKASGNGNMSISTEDCKLEFLVSYSYLAMTHLPASSGVEYIKYSGVPNKMEVSWNGNNASIVSNEIYDGPIIIASANRTVSSSGALPVYFTTPHVASNNGYERIIEVKLEDGSMYRGELPNSEYRIGYNSRRILSEIKRVPNTLTVSTDATFPELFPYDIDENGYCESVPEALLAYGWKAGDEVSAINLTKGEVLAGTLIAGQTGKTTTFSGTLSGEMGIDVNDHIALIYPAIGNENPYDFKTQPVIIDTFAFQDGETTALPCALKGHYFMNEDGNLEGYEEDSSFEHLTSMAKVHIDNVTYNPHNDDVEVDGDGEEDDPEYTLTSSEILGINEIIVRIPGKLMLAYDYHGYEGEEPGIIMYTLNDEVGITITNENLQVVDDVLEFYLSFPAGGEEDVITSLAVNTTLSDYSETSEYYTTNLRSFLNIRGCYYELELTGGEFVDDNTNI